MFGFNGSLQGFRKIIAQIADNQDTQKFTHKQVRAYARCMLILVPSLDLADYQRTQITVLLAAMSAGQLPHYDRSFLAEELLKILDKAIEQVNRKKAEYEDIF